jgi:hypothetical protein
VDPYLPSPLPAWALAIIFLEPPGRFARSSFGHEYYQHLLGDQDIRVRAQREYSVRRQLINIAPDSELARRNRAFIREIVWWIEYHCQIFPPPFTPPGLAVAREILREL